MGAAYLKGPENPQVFKCKIKTWHLSEKVARRIGAHRLFKQSTLTPLWPYVCSICGYWHLTSSPQRGVRQIDETDLK